MDEAQLYFPSSTTNTIGQKVQSISNPTQTIDVSEFKTGTYFVRFVTDKGIKTSTFIKK